jgi:metacaspase-1
MANRVYRGCAAIVIIGAVLLSIIPTRAADGDLNSVIKQRITDWETPGKKSYDGRELRDFAWVPTAPVAPPVTSPGKGISLHVGLNRVDLKAYPGTPDLAACENDARDMEKLAKAGGFQTKLLLSEQATAKQVLAEIKAAAETLKAGETFLFTYSGHGGERRDTNGDEDKDQTLCTYERQIIDDELGALWATFKPGVRIVMIADSCHSGTNFKYLKVAEGLRTRSVRGAEEPERTRMIQQAQTLAKEGKLKEGEKSTFRTLGPINQKEVNDKQKAVLDEVKKVTPRESESIQKFQASLIHLAACQDNQLAGERGANGLFTAAILRSVGRPEGATYESLLNETARLLQSEPDQRPRFNKDGTGADELAKRPPFQP